MTLYDTMGRQVMHVDMESGDNLFEAPVTAGMYTVLIRYRKADTTKNYKLIVQ
jgi:acyl dehydratase